MGGGKFASRICQKQQIMKSLRVIFALLLSLAFIACGKFTEVDLGYPKRIEFSKDGGEKVARSDNHFSNAEIHDYKSGENGTPTTLEDGAHCNTFKWLRVEYQPHSTEIKIIAEPNNDTSRKLHIELYSGYEYQVIEVIQNAN